MMVMWALLFSGSFLYYTWGLQYVNLRDLKWNKATTTCHTNKIMWLCSYFLIYFTRCWHYMVLGFRFFIKKEYSQKTNFCAFLNRDTKKRWLWRRRRRPPMNASTSPFFPANNNERTSKTHFVWTRLFRRCLFKNTTQTSSFFSTKRFHQGKMTPPSTKAATPSSSSSSDDEARKPGVASNAEMRAFLEQNQDKKSNHPMRSSGVQTGNSQSQIAAPRNGHMQSMCHSRERRKPWADRTWIFCKRSKKTERYSRTAEEVGEDKKVKRGWRKKGLRTSRTALRPASESVVGDVWPCVKTSKANEWERKSRRSHREDVKLFHDKIVLSIL